MELDGFGGLDWGSLWPRHIAYGECHGWVGSGLIIVMTRAFTPDEDLLFDWVAKQDRCHLYGIHHMQDGRDLIVFERQFVSQSQADAVAEHQAHLRKVLSQAGVIPLTFIG